MKNVLRIEEALMLALAVHLNASLPYPAWLFWALFLAPDVAFLGYAVNSRVGAICYNVLHHKGVGIALYIAGFLLESPELQLPGLLIFGHSSFDRMLGYGLKFFDSFHNTHLGPIGKAR